MLDASARSAFPALSSFRPRFRPIPRTPLNRKRLWSWIFFRVIEGSTKAVAYLIAALKQSIYVQHKTYNTEMAGIVNKAAWLQSAKANPLVVGDATAWPVGA